MQQMDNQKAPAKHGVYSKYVREIKLCPEAIKIYEDNIRPDAFPLEPPALMTSGKHWPEMTKFLEVTVIDKPCAAGYPVAIDPEKPVYEITPYLLAEGDDETPLYNPNEGVTHVHRHEEIYLFLGTNPDNPEDLGGELELWLGLGTSAERFLITKSTAVILPPGVSAQPMVFRKVNRPILKVVIYDNPIYHMIPAGSNPPAFKPDL